MDAIHLPKDNKFGFHGDGGSLFKLFIVNFFLTLITFGIYYPWAKAAFLQYFYRQTEFSGNRFQFHGTGKEMFIGMIKSVGIFLIIGAVSAAIAKLAEAPVAAVIFFYLCIIALLPFAIVGSLRYRLSRSSWRGIHFGYRGTVKDMATVYIKGILLSIVTLGIYSAWLIVSVEKEVKSNIRMGNLEFDYDGKGGELFVKFIVGYLLTLLTLGIYSFWWLADLHNYSNNNTFMYQEGKTAKLNSTVTGGGLFKLGIVNFFILVFTLGFGLPWTIVRNSQYYCENLSVEGDIDLASIQQTEFAYTDATGEELADGFDLNVI